MAGPPAVSALAAAPGTAPGPALCGASVKYLRRRSAGG